MPSNMEDWLQGLPPFQQVHSQALQIWSDVPMAPDSPGQNMGSSGLVLYQTPGPMEMATDIQDGSDLLDGADFDPALAFQPGLLTSHELSETQITDNMSALHSASAVTESDNQSTSSSKALAGSGHVRKGKNATGKESQPSVPLVCHICQGNPTFSDVSHLLTHCSSRAHTKRHFDMKARALTELSAQQTLSIYDQWYEDFEIGPMINKRLREKDEKDQAKRIEAETRKSNQPPQKRRKVPAKTQQTKQEGKEEFPIQTLPLTTPFKSTMDQQGQGTLLADEELEDLPIPGLQSPNGSEFDSFEMGDEYFDRHDEPSGPPLKGKFWPGMGIFDAATEEERRKRNQRKDVSVIQKMKTASQAVETSELVGDLTLVWARMRDVYDPPSCDDETPPKRKSASGRKAGATPRRSGRKKGTAVVRIKSEPQTPPVGHLSIEAPVQVGGRRRATRGSAARAQVQISRMARREIEGAPEASQDSEDDPQLKALIKHDSSSSFGQGNSTRPSTADMSSDGRGANTMADIFQDDDVDPADLAMHLPGGSQGPARFPHRSRPPLHPLNRNVRPNAASNLSSPTPSIKPIVTRACGGKENNSELQQGMAMVPQPPGMSSQAMPYSGMGMQGMPRTVWGTNMNQPHFQYPFGNAFADNLLLPPVMMGNQVTNAFQQHPQMNSMYPDDMQNGLFRTHSPAGNQGWQANPGENMGLHQGMQNLYSNNWLANNQGVSYDDTQNDGDGLQDH